MRELFRQILSANLLFTGLVLVVAAVLTFYGSAYLIMSMNLGKKLAFLVIGAGISGWWIINTLMFVLYAPRGPRPLNFEGLNAFEIRIIPGTMLLASVILFAMFLTALSRYEAEQNREIDR